MIELVLSHHRIMSITKIYRVDNLWTSAPRISPDRHWCCPFANPEQRNDEGYYPTINGPDIWRDVAARYDMYVLGQGRNLAHAMISGSSRPGPFPATSNTRES